MGGKLELFMNWKDSVISHREVGLETRTLALNFILFRRLIFNIFEKLDQNITRSRMIKYPKHQLEGLGEISNFLHKFIDTLCDKTRALSLTDGPVFSVWKINKTFVKFLSYSLWNDLRSFWSSWRNLSHPSQWL